MKTSMFVKVRIFREGDTFFTAKWVAVEVPKNFVQVCSISEFLYQ